MVFPTALNISYEGKLQHQTSNKVRATISSVKGFFIEIMGLVVYIGFGLLADLLDYQVAFIIFGYVYNFRLLIIIIGIVYLVRPLTFRKYSGVS